jgi:hypothetical protein
MANEFNPMQAGTMSPEDYAQQQALTRQQQMAQLLMQQSTQQPQGQMVSGRYVPTSFFQNILPIANIAASKYVGEKADTEAAKLAQKIRENKSAANQEVLNKLLGTPATPGVEGNIYGPNGQLTKETTADMYGADMQLNPQYKQVAPVAGKAATKPDLAGALRAIESPTNYYGAGKDLKATIVNRLNPEKPSDQLGYELAQSQGFPGTFMDYKTGLANASAGRTYTNIQNQLPFKEGILKGAADKLINKFDVLVDIPTTLENMDKMVQLSKQPIFGGVGGETKLQIVKLLNNNLGTNISPEAVKNTEEFKSAAYMGIMDNLKKTDSNPTMAQQNALKEAIGSLGTDPAAIPRVVNVMRDVLVSKAKQHNKNVEQTIQNGVQYPYDIRVQLPQETPAAPGMPNNSIFSRADAIINRKPGVPQ